ncbi:hypothetical protein ACIBCT_38800 [Streptosporangium sp. NPDC050855]|uniref:hypothetical protein n=1 Tax=Streptosporangium sp. NPDC050855 TaxID=3366194 RepID=UPI0037A5DD37
MEARYAEDERVARADSGHSQEWHTEVAREDPYDESRACVCSGQGDVITHGVAVERADHIAYYDPSRRRAARCAPGGMQGSHPDNRDSHFKIIF